MVIRGKRWLISHLLKQNVHASWLINKLTTVSYNKTSLVPPTPHPHKIFRLSYGPALKSALLWKLIICSKSGNLTWQSNLHAREPVHYYMMFVVVVTFLYYCCRHIYGSYMSVSKSQVEILSHGKAFRLEFTFHFVFSYKFGGSAIILILILVESQILR